MVWRLVRGLLAYFVFHVALPVVLTASGQFGNSVWGPVFDAAIMAQLMIIHAGITIALLLVIGIFLVAGHVVVRWHYFAMCCAVIALVQGGVLFAIGRLNEISLVAFLVFSGPLSALSAVVAWLVAFGWARSARLSFRADGSEDGRLF